MARFSSSAVSLLASATFWPSPIRSLARSNFRTKSGSSKSNKETPKGLFWNPTGAGSGAATKINPQQSARDNKESKSKRTNQKASSSSKGNNNRREDTVNAASSTPLKNRLFQAQGKDSGRSVPLPTECDPRAADIGILACQNPNEVCHVSPHVSQLGGVCVALGRRRRKLEQQPYGYLPPPYVPPSTDQPYGNIIPPYLPPPPFYYTPPTPPYSLGQNYCLDAGYGGRFDSCDCTLWDSASRTGAFSCTRANACDASCLDDTCFDATFQYTVTDSRLMTLTYCQDFTTPYSQTFCDARTRQDYVWSRGHACILEVNGEECSTCMEHGSGCVTYDCTNVPGGGSKQVCSFSYYYSYPSTYNENNNSNGGYYTPDYAGDPGAVQYTSNPDLPPYVPYVSPNYWARNSRNNPVAPIVSQCIKAPAIPGQSCLICGEDGTVTDGVDLEVLMVSFPNIGDFPCGYLFALAYMGRLYGTGCGYVSVLAKDVCCATTAAISTSETGAAGPEEIP